MSQPSASAGWRCSECGAESYWPSSPRCWLCGGTVRLKKGTEKPVGAIVLDEPAADRRAALYAVLSTVLLVLALAAVLVGIWAMAPGLGIVLALLTLPTLIVSEYILQNMKRLGEPVGSAQKIAVFFHSFGLVVVLLVVTAIAGFVALIAICAAGISVLSLN